MKENKELINISSEFGYDKTLFLDKDFVLIEGDDCKQLLKKSNKASKDGLLCVARAKDEKSLRFLLEHTKVSIVFGIENIHYKDSVHYPRTGFDQVLAKIAAENCKVIGFSFSDILEIDDNFKRGMILNRIKYIIKFCKKYGVSYYLFNLSSNIDEIRSRKDLESFLRFVVKSKI